MIRLAKCSTLKDGRCSQPPGSVYIGRRMDGLVQSPLHNPFKVDDYGPDLCLRLYRLHVLRCLVDAQPRAFREPKLGAAAQLVLALAKLTEDSVLACWCCERPAFIEGQGDRAPSRRCHGDIVATVVHNLGPVLRSRTSASIAPDGTDVLDDRPIEWVRVPGEQVAWWSSAVQERGRDASLVDFAGRCFGFAEQAEILELDHRLRRSQSA